MPFVCGRVWVCTECVGTPHTRHELHPHTHCHQISLVVKLVVISARTIRSVLGACLTDSTSTLIAPAACDGVRENAGARGKYLPGTLGLHRAITMCITPKSTPCALTLTWKARESVCSRRTCACPGHVRMRARPNQCSPSRRSTVAPRASE